MRVWTKIEGQVQTPEKELGARPVENLACMREEKCGQWPALVEYHVENSARHRNYSARTASSTMPVH